MSIATDTTEAAILARVVDGERGDLPLDLARALLVMEFSPSDRAEMHRLAEINQAGQLTGEQQRALDAYRRVGYFLDLMKSKARRSLKQHSPN